MTKNIFKKMYKTKTFDW